MDEGGCEHVTSKMGDTLMADLILLNMEGMSM